MTSLRARLGGRKDSEPVNDCISGHCHDEEVRKGRLATTVNAKVKRVIGSPSQGRRLAAFMLVAVFVVINNLDFSDLGSEVERATLNSPLSTKSSFGSRNAVERASDEGEGMTFSPSAKSPVVVLGKSYEQSKETDEKDADKEKRRHSEGHLNEAVGRLNPKDFPEDGVHPYEVRWPGFKVPDWAKKPFFFRTDAPIEKQVCFVHVGKTAGSSVGCSLGFQLHCADTKQYPLGLLPEYTTRVFHNGVNDCFDDMGYYMITLRNPLKRIQSWFPYDRPIEVTGAEGGWTGAAKAKKGKKRWHGRDKLYFDCPFKHLNDLAEYGLGKNASVSVECQERAQRAIEGKERFGMHNFFNYRYYYSSVPSNATVVAIRTEHLQKDWSSVEKMIGGTKVRVAFPQKNRKAKDPADTYLSDNSRVMICQALCEDIQIYKEILHRAQNLDDEDVIQSMKELRESCPREADASNCVIDH